MMNFRSLKVAQIVTTVGPEVIKLYIAGCESRDIVRSKEETTP